METRRFENQLHPPLLYFMVLKVGHHWSKEKGPGINQAPFDI
jgi:hypothetical protein